tara:strand:+ start:139 stop:495 length:357 start_codon:yes stop_codon:yes gene_type:complete
MMVRLLLRGGLAFSFLYVAINSFLEPQNWIGFFPVWMLNLAGDSMLLGAFSIFEIILALWLLSGKKGMYAALVSAGLLLGIVVMNLGALSLIFRDISLATAALALAYIEYYGYPNRRN